MLQSALFSNHQVIGANRPGPSVIVSRMPRLNPVGLPRLASWTRALFVRDEVADLSEHLRRDIGLDTLVR